MSRFSRAKRGIVLIAATSLSTVAQADSLTTTYAAGNGQDGNIFDITALHQVEITGFDIHMDACTDVVEIWYRTDSGLNDISGSSGWTLHHSETITGGGEGSPVSFQGPISITIPQGETYGFYVTVTNTIDNCGFKYTNGSGVGNVYAADSNIEITEGYGMEYFFGSSYNPRIWNGTVYYEGCDSSAPPIRYLDADGDGFGDPTQVVADCAPPAGYVEDGTDCDDSDASVYPGATEVCDGRFTDCSDPAYSAVLSPLSEDDNDGDGYIECSYDSTTWMGSSSVVGGDDCDDSQNAVFPSASEICDGQYNNCSDLAYDSLSAPAAEQDGDGDGYVVCLYDSATWAGSPSVVGGEDCDDNNDWIYPSASEFCDGQYNDCNDPSFSTGVPSAEADLDGDSYVQCSLDPSVPWVGSSITGGDDCNDSDSTVYPEAIEVCDGQYNDCTDASYDATSAPSVELDVDFDGYIECAFDSSIWVGGIGVIGGGDCDSNDSLVYPSAVEVCDGQYNNCSDILYDSISSPSSEQDDDADGYVECSFMASIWVGDPAVIGGNDCNDSDVEVYPGAVEVCDGRYTDCSNPAYSSTSAPVPESDADGDGYVECTFDSSLWLGASTIVGGDDCDDSESQMYPGAAEVCDGLDNDCDGSIDPGFADFDVDALADCVDTDDDNDGLTDEEEAILGTDPLDEDSDSDGLGDAEEVGFDATSNDSDEDGIIDALDDDDDGDSMPTVNENSYDIDGDGVADNDVDGDGIINSLDDDSDGDGIADSIELAGDPDGDGIPSFLDDDSDGNGTPDSEDSLDDMDSDGVPDFLDTDDTDGPDADMDGDGLSNGEEAELGTDATNPDSDSDGLSDGEEELAGTDPLDSDSDDDEVSDGDEVQQGTDPLNSDSDGDGLSEGEEEQAGTDPLDSDSDDDGLLDEEELDVGTDPLNPDSDDDGLSDSEEVDQGTDPLSSDSDDDGLSDSEEMDAGTDPLNSDSDGDGVSDGEEGLGDDDGDGVINALDDTDDSGTEKPEGCSSVGQDNAGLWSLLVVLTACFRRRRRS